MLRIKEILNRKYYIREIILLVFIVLSLLYLSIYTSFAIFEKTIEKTGIIAFEASEIMLSVSSEETAFQISDNKEYGTITIPAGETKIFNITVINETPTDVKYKTWYKFTSGVTILDVEIGVSNTSENENTSTLTKNGTDGSQKVISVVIKNNSTQNATIDIGVQGGYVNNEVVLNNGNNEMSLIELNVEITFNNDTEHPWILNDDKYTFYSLTSSKSENLSTEINFSFNLSSPALLTFELAAAFYDVSSEGIAYTIIKDGNTIITSEFASDYGNSPSKFLNANYDGNSNTIGADVLGYKTESITLEEAGNYVVQFVANWAFSPGLEMASGPIAYVSNFNIEIGA